MRNRKTVVVAFMLCAVMLLGIGYAALTDTLTIIGNAHIDMNQAQVNFDEMIYFSAAEAVTNPTADAVSFSADDATFTANKLATKGDKAVFKFTVQNDSNVSINFVAENTKLSGDPNPTNSNTSKFNVTYEYSIDNQVIPSGGSMDITVTVEVVGPVTTATSATFGIEYSISTVDA